MTHLEDWERDDELGRWWDRVNASPHDLGNYLGDEKVDDRVVHGDAEGVESDLGLRRIDLNVHFGVRVGRGAVLEQLVAVFSLYRLGEHHEFDLSALVDGDDANLGQLCQEGGGDSNDLV